MIVICVTVLAKPGMGQAFLAAALRDREGTRKEPGNIRFDVLQGATPVQEGEPEPFYLFEIYDSAESFAAHQQTPHFLLFREETADLSTPTLLCPPRQTPSRPVSLRAAPCEHPP